MLADFERASVLPPLRTAGESGCMSDKFKCNTSQTASNERRLQGEMTVRVHCLIHHHEASTYVLLDCYQGTFVFLSDVVLGTARQQCPVVRTVTDDLVSLCWVTFYAAYVHALSDKEGMRRAKTHSSWNDKDMRGELEAEFHAYFSAPTVDAHTLQRLLQSLENHSSGPDGHMVRDLRDPLRFLYEYARHCAPDSVPLAGVIVLTWTLIERFATPVKVVPHHMNDAVAAIEKFLIELEPQLDINWPDPPPPSYDDFVQIYDTALRSI